MYIMDYISIFTSWIVLDRCHTYRHTHLLNVWGCLCVCLCVQVVVIGMDTAEEKEAWLADVNVAIESCTSGLFSPYDIQQA